MPEENKLPLKARIVALPKPIHGGLIRETAQRCDIAESDILDLSASLNPMGNPFDHPSTGLSLDTILMKATGHFAQYPDNRYLEFKYAAARFLGQGVDHINIIPGNGSCEIIRLVAECMLEENDVVLIPQPTFAEYEQQCRLVGADIQYLDQDELFEVSDELLDQAKILFVCNPNNPTGRLIERDRLKTLASRCTAHQTLLFVDEAFIELADPDQSIADLAAADDHVFVMRSLTKNFAIPGVRLGFGVASPDMAMSLNTARLPWNLGSIPDMIGTALLNMDGGCNSSYLVRSRALIEEDREYLIERLSKVRRFRPLSSSVNYVLVDLSESSIDSVDLSQRLASQGILVRDCSSFPGLGNDFIRVAVRSRTETDRLTKAIGVAVVGDARDTAMKKLNHMIEEGKGKPLGGNTACPYYPCHFPGQDCTFCFCPFYPCKDERTGGKWIERSSGGKVWSCEDCTLVHRPENVQAILDDLIGDGSMDERLAKAWDRVVKPLL